MSPCNVINWLFPHFTLISYHWTRILLIRTRRNATLKMTCSAGMHLLYHPWSMIFKCQWPGSPCWGSPMIYAKYIFSPYVFIYIIYTFTPPILIPNWKVRRLRLESWSAGGVACRAPIHNGARTRNLNSLDPGTGDHPPPSTNQRRPLWSRDQLATNHSPRPVHLHLDWAQRVRGENI